MAMSDMMKMGCVAVGGGGVGSGVEWYGEDRLGLCGDGGYFV